MSTFLGREAELARARAVVESAASGRLVRAFRIVGTSGVGKTALANAIADRAAVSGWLVINAQSYRIHAGLPLFAARRVIQALLQALGEGAARYTSGLTIDRERAEDFKEAFLRIVEGVTLDHCLLLVLDDAQWMDAESRELIAGTATSLADRPIVLLSTERNDEQYEPSVPLIDETIALEDLPPAVACDVVRVIYPSVTAEVAADIVAATRGHAMDLVAVATAARESGARDARDVNASTRRVVARDLALLEPQARSFLQILALIEEPIDLSLLQQFWTRERLLALISEVSGRYLVEDRDGLRFVHASIMESVLETIPIEIPLRYRIIDALKRLEAPRLEDYERLARQSLACGDRALARETLLKLAEAAAARSIYTLATSAMERAFKISPARPEELIPLYARLSQMYNANGRSGDAVRVCREALALAHDYGMSDGVGSIAASLALGLHHSGQNPAAVEELAEYEAAMHSDADRAQLYSVGEYIAITQYDLARANEIAASFEAIAAPVNPLLAVRHEINRAFLALRTGDEAGALERVRAAERTAASLPALISTMPRAFRMLHAFGYAGVNGVERFIESRDGELNEILFDYLRAQTMVARGAFEDARDFVAENLGRYAEGLGRYQLLSALAAASAFAGIPVDDARWEPAAPAIAAFFSGQRSPALWIIASAWAAARGANGRTSAKALLRDLLELHANPFDVAISPYPLLLSISARRLDDKESLERIAAGAVFCDEQPWNRAHWLLARAAAYAGLGKPESRALGESAAQLFATLGAGYFASYATTLVTGSSAAKGAAEARPSNTTRREREIAALVAEGLTNREVAERLVLSERTVEGHIANLFAKVDVNSRTQLATWYLRSVTPVA